MKKYLLPSLLITASAAFAQTPNTLQINLKSGQQVEYTIDEIKDITFAEKSTETPEVKSIKFAVPTIFTGSYVQKVMSGGKQIAEIDKEYIKSAGKQLTVIYPCDENGKADLTKGITSTGASVVWDLSANTATVGTEGDPVETFYLVEGELLTAYDGATVDATIAPDQLIDIRGTETNTYALCKIGTFYCMAENLRTTKYADGSAIDAISETETDAWKANTSGAYLNYGDAQWVAYAGYLYNGYTIFNKKGIAPEGWAVPTSDEYTKIKSAGGTAMANFKDSTELSWGNNGAGNNMTGFTAVATGYFSTATGYTGLNTESYFWSSTKTYDKLSKDDIVDYFRLTATGKNVVVSTPTLGNGHSQAFGHCIRLIRK